MQIQKRYAFRTPLRGFGMVMPTTFEYVLDEMRKNERGEFEVSDFLVATNGMTILLAYKDSGDLFELHNCPEIWEEAWKEAAFPLSEYRGEAAFAVISSIEAHLPQRQRGQRGVGRHNRDQKDYLVAEVFKHARTEKKSLRSAVSHICELAVDKDVPWPWRIIPDSRSAENTLRKEVQRYKRPNRRKK